MSAYYNEIDPFAAAWLKELIKAGHIAPGEVDTRSIEDVVPSDLAGFEQCHFFAGIGVWSYALRCAGWPDDRPVWTGSCPCQPFSAAGKRSGFIDERHLWPAFHYLISQCRPPVVFGEQVASKDGLAWLDLIQVDLEGAGYACGAVDTCAAGIGAPHIRQRVYWVTDAASNRRHGTLRQDQREEIPQAVGRGGTCKLGNAFRAGLEGHSGYGHEEAGRQKTSGSAAETGGTGWMENTCSHGRQARGEHNNGDDGGQSGAAGALFWPGPTNGYWQAVDWLYCRDGRWRPVEPGTCPLAHGAANRVGRLRGYGNAIVAPQAAAFIGAYMECNMEKSE